MQLLDDEDFKNWIIDKAKNQSPQEMVEDNAFSCRLLIDVLHGRSKRFNKRSREKTSQAGGVTLLYSEYISEIYERRNADEEGSLY